MEKRRVLVVDDEENLRKLLNLNLEATGKFTVETLANVKDLIDTLHMFKPEVILLDILMPKTGGAEACMMLNEDPETKLIPVIVISALDTENDRRAMKESGAVDFIVKPIEKAELISRIEKVLRGRG